MKQRFRFIHPVITQEVIGHPHIKALSFERENVSLLHISSQIKKMPGAFFKMSYWVYYPKISKHFFFFYHITPLTAYLQQMLLYHPKVS